MDPQPNAGSRPNVPNAVNIYGGGTVIVGEGNTVSITREGAIQGRLDGVSVNPNYSSTMDNIPPKEIILEEITNAIKKRAQVSISLVDGSKVTDILNLRWTLQEKTEKDVTIADSEILSKYPNAKSFVIMGQLFDGLTSLSKKLAHLIFFQPGSSKYIFHLELLSVNSTSVQEAIKKNYFDKSDYDYWKFIENYQDEVLFVVDMPKMGSIDFDSIFNALPGCKIIVTVLVNAYVNATSYQSDVKLCVKRTCEEDLRTINELVFVKTKSESETLIKVLHDYQISELATRNLVFIIVICNCWNQRVNIIPSATDFTRSIIMGCMQKFILEYNVEDIETFTEDLYNCFENAGKFFLSKGNIEERSFALGEFRDVCPNYKKLCDIGLAFKQDVDMALKLRVVDPLIESFLAARFIRNNLQQLNMCNLDGLDSMIPLYISGMANSDKEFHQVFIWILKQKCDESLKHALVESCLREFKHVPCLKTKCILPATAAIASSGLAKGFPLKTDEDFIESLLSGGFVQKPPLSYNTYMVHDVEASKKPEHPRDVSTQQNNTSEGVSVQGVEKLLNFEYFKPAAHKSYPLSKTLFVPVYSAGNLGLIALIRAYLLLFISF